MASIIDVLIQGYDQNRGENGQQEKSATWLVVFDGTDGSPEQIEAFFGIYPGDQFGGASEVRASSISAKRDPKCFRFWYYTVNYSSQQSDSDNPLDQPFQITFSGSKYDKIVEFDRSGNPILNSAHEPFLNPVKDDAYDEIIRVQKYRPFDSSAVANFVANKVNSSVWNGRAAGTVLTGFPERQSEVHLIGGQRQIIWNDSLVFAHRAEGWAVRKLDEGFHYFDQNNKLVEATTDNLKQKKTSVLLDGSGHKLEQGADPVALTFHLKQELSFSIFGLDGVVP